MWLASCKRASFVSSLPFCVSSWLIHVVPYMKFYFYGWIVFHYTAIPQFWLLSLLLMNIGCGYLLVAMNKVVMSVHMEVFPSTCFWFVGSGGFVFNFLGKCEIVFHSECVFKIPTSNAQKLSMSIIVGTQWYLVVVLTYIFLMYSAVEHLFMCFLAICLFSLGNNRAFSNYRNYF